MSRVVLVVCLLGGLLAAMPARASARVSVVSIADLGYAQTITLPGVYPSFTFNVPVSSTLRSARLSLNLRVSPLADPNSSIQVTVNDVNVYTRQVGKAGGDLHVAVELPVPDPPATNMKVTVKGHLYITGDICLDSQTSDLWIAIEKGSSLAFVTEVGLPDTPISDFFAGYGRRIVIVDKTAGGAAIAALPYHIRQIEYWHQPEIVLGDRADRNARNLVVQNGVTRYDPRSETLYVDPRDLALIQARAVKYLLTSGVTPGTSAVGTDPKSDAKQVAFSQLGFRPQTASGPSDLGFDFPLDSSQLGGIPRNLHLHLSYTYTPLLAGSTGLVQVLANGALVASRELSKGGGNLVWEVAIPGSSLAPSNYLHVQTSHYTGLSTCKGDAPQMTATISDASYLSWSSLDKSVDGVSSFLKSVNGRVVLLVGEGLTPRAFHLMSELGRLDRRIGTLTAAKFDGTVPPGFDYAIIVAAPEQLAKIPGPILLGESAFHIVNPLTNETLFQTSYDKGVGILETTSVDGAPTLILSYWKQPGPLMRFMTYDSAVLAQQSGNIALFDRNIETFDVGKKLRVSYVSGDPFERIWGIARLPIAIVLVILIFAFIAFAMRRLTGGETT